MTFSSSTSIGADAHIETSICKNSLALQKGDFILLCTDGLTNMIDDQSIIEIIVMNATVAIKTENLIEKANNSGGKENSTATLIEIE